MKTIFEPSVREAFLSRIDTLTQDHQSNWGKMNAYEMLAHGVQSEDMMQGRLVIKRVMIGRLIGKMVLNKVLRADAPFDKHSPTSPHLKTLGKTGDFDQEREAWKQRIADYGTWNGTYIMHPFFGKMSRGQIGRFVYKHIDHHLRQFGV